VVSAVKSERDLNRAKAAGRATREALRKRREEAKPINWAERIAVVRDHLDHLDREERS
jgi:hypothetical protein